ncbi:MAG TPA: type III-B CRISPR module RAMP protein Cmr6 [Thermoanaerobaculia bacterium]|nr:type III-B CRISPR module RAMP protein Cmr6 [Thermoanaerobaculia bacterium]
MTSRRENLKGIEPVAGTHAGLWLETWIFDVAAKDSAKQQHLDQVIANASAPDEYVRFFRRWKECLKTLEPCTLLAQATAVGRMAVGLGAESVLETSLALHHTYGVPYIPGSALKGLAASAAHKSLEDEKWTKKDAEGKVGEAHRILFGDQESSGYVAFQDALWIPPASGSRLPLDLDVTTVHHPDYYQGKADAPPADWDSPTPVAFLSTRGSYLLAVTGPRDWANAALDILTEALKQEGIGAKTAAGYGRMTVVREPETGTRMAAPSAPVKEARIREIHLGNADTFVPRLLGELNGEERRAAARAVLSHLGQKAVKKKQEKDWARLLLEAAEP